MRIGKLARRTFLTLIVVAFAGVASSQPASQQTVAYAAADDMFQLTQAAPSATRPLVVDRTALLSLLVTAASRTLTVMVTSPAGARFTIGDQNSAAGFQSQIVPIANGSTLGAAYVATFANPAVGNWTFTVAERSQLSTPLDIVAAVGLNNGTRLALLSGDDSLPPGVAVRMAAVVFDAAKKLTGLTVTGVVRSTTNASFAPVTVTFRDDGAGGDERAGDSIYEAFVTTASPSLPAGTYVLHIQAAGTASTGAFRRTAAAQFRIVRRDAEIATFLDFGVDDDFDGYYDRVVIAPEATVETAGTYRIAVRLRASNGHEIQHSVDRAFPAGSATAEVSFTASEITGDLGVSGPYSVAEVRYSHVSNADVIPADVRYDLGTTDAYALDDLRHPTIRLTGQGVAFGIDENDNGLFDALEIAIELAVDFSGSYDASVSLVDRDNREIGFASGTIHLTAGDNGITITFDGRAIGMNGIDGPYTLANLIVFGEGQSLIATTAFVTPAFEAREFEGYRPRRRRSVQH
ncbi:MAG TPA: choice-of-anchor X domain-containing protein [Thermoanaerobaculia bacterium]|nr:choice-of-anchor X domain-containing protein [Thermoanaerobaculia bacterium]